MIGDSLAGKQTAIHVASSSKSITLLLMTTDNRKLFEPFQESTCQFSDIPADSFSQPRKLPIFPPFLVLRLRQLANGFFGKRMAQVNLSDESIKQVNRQTMQNAKKRKHCFC